MLQTSRPDLGDVELQAIARVFTSGYLGMGPEVQAFEQELEIFFGNDRKVVCTSSGTAALHLALSAIGVGAGDEVLVPTLTFVATFQAVAMTGAQPVACDVLLENGLLDLADAKRRISARTKAVIPVHYAGNPGGLEDVYAWGRENSLRIVEDAAHAFGTNYKDKTIGGQGDIVCFSFDAIKNITCGEGGAVVVADNAIADTLRKMRQLGIERGAMSTDFDVSGVGWRYHMPDILAGIGRAQLARFNASTRAARLALGKAFRNRLMQIPGVTLLAIEGEIVPHIMPIRVDARVREKVRNMLEIAGFETKVHYKPNHLLSAFCDGTPRPVAEKLYAELISLPFHLAVTGQDIESIADTIERALWRA